MKSHKILQDLKVSTPSVFWLVEIEPHMILTKILRDLSSVAWKPYDVAESLQTAAMHKAMRLL